MQSGEGPTIKIVNTILMNAVRSGAESVRIEPGVDTAEVSYQPEIQEPPTKFPLHVLTSVVTRIKTMAHLTPESESGLIRLKYGEDIYNVQVRIEPSQFGERVEMNFEPSAA